MAINSITVIQDNLEGVVDLMTVHNPLVYIMSVEYTISVPLIIYAEIQDSDSAVLDTFQCVLIEDNLVGTAKFYFYANDVLTEYMGDIEDYNTPYNTLEFVEPLSKGFKIRFHGESEEDNVSLIAYHGVQQFGNTPANVDVYNNVDLLFFGAIGMPVYIYFYNNSESNDIGVGIPANDYALDWDDTVFADNDNVLFRF